MPLIKSAKKKMRQDHKRTARNRLRKGKIHAAIKAVENAVKKKEGADKMGAALIRAYKAIDKAVKRNLIHKKTGSRRKSRVARLAKATASAEKAQASS
ncbi:MAG: 30S ribosomal protein S20 [Patescibacteria group bacterium]